MIRNTPGPWRAREVVNQMDDPGSTVATVGKRTDGTQWHIFSDGALGNTEVDARLIAAAPELLRTLYNLMRAAIHLEIDFLDREQIPHNVWAELSPTNDEINAANDLLIGLGIPEYGGIDDV